MLARGKRLKYVKLSFERVLPMISRQDNITDPSRSDGRCNQANEFHQDYGALSNQVTSPIREQSRNQSFSEDRSDAYLLAQDKLFDLLKEDQKLPGNEFT